MLPCRRGLGSLPTRIHGARRLLPCRLGWISATAPANWRGPFPSGRPHRYISPELTPGKLPPEPKDIARCGPVGPLLHHGAW